jgi:DNA-directed RNA polymerase III subunit RPC3
VKSTLVVLVQNHLIHFSEHDDGFHYSANGDAAYNMTFRYGKFARMVKNRFGDDAVQVFMKIATLGHARIGDLVHAFDANKPLLNGASKSTQEAQHSSRVNGIPTDNTTKSPLSSVAHLHRTVDRLLSSGFLRLVSEWDYASDIDTKAAAEYMINSRYPEGKPKGKQKPEAAAAIEAQVRQWRDDALSQIDDSQPPLKRRKIDGASHDRIPSRPRDDDTEDDDEEANTNIRISV